MDRSLAPGPVPLTPSVSLSTALVGALVLTGLTSGCAGERIDDGPIRLIDRYRDAHIEGSTEPPVDPAPTEWSFAGGEASGSWRAGARVSDLELTDQGLAGRAAGRHPALVLELPEPAGVDDALYEIVVRIRVSEGESMSLTTTGGEGPPAAALAADESPLTLSLPLIPGAEMHTYTIALRRQMALGPLARSAITGVVLQPTDAPDADFTLESVRLVFRKEHLAAIPTGVGWHGLSEIWRETIVSRPDESLTWTLELPREPWLDIAVGTISEQPVGFDVTLAEPGAPAGATPLLQHAETLTTAERWHERRIDLAGLCGRTVELTLAARGDEGAIAFWGAPVVRGGAGDGRAEASAPPGVIVVLADTLRKHHLAAYGHERQNSPHISRLAAEGVVFNDPIAQGTWTKVSVPSILSATYPATHGIVSFNDRLSSVAVTLAEALQEAGFATWASSSVAFSGQLTNLHQGVEVLHERASVDQPDGVSSSKTGRVFVDRLIPWLERHRDVPFFAFVHAMDPHSPYRPYPPYDTVYSDETAGSRYEEELDAVRAHIKDDLLRRFGMPHRSEMEAAGLDIERYLEHERNWYDASILGLDTEVGRILETLHRIGRDRNTIVALVSDHGEEFLEHDMHWHGLTVYAEMIEVPLVLRWPAGMPGGVRVDGPVQTIDLMPTLLEALGLPIPETVQGRSLLPYWAEPGVAPRMPPVFTERRSQREPTDPQSPWARSDSLALVSDEWKLIWNLRRGPGVPEVELFHRPSDPLDQANVAAEQPDVVARLRETLERWHQSALAARLPDGATAAEGMSAEELEQLRSLGYL